MIKVLIVEDEHKISQMLQMMMDWSAFDMCVVGTADSSMQALAMASGLRPDVILTDIRLPGMSGLDLIEQVKIMLPQCEFIVISGYREFDYAQKAVKLEVAEYLLKPVNEEDLGKALRKVLSRIYVRKSSDESKAEMEKQISQSQECLWERFAADAFENHLETLSVRDIYETYRVKLQSGNFRVACVKLDLPQGKKYLPNENMKEVVRERLSGMKSAVTDYFVGYGIRPYYYIRNYWLFILLDEPAGFQRKPDYALLLEKLKKSINRYEGIMISLGASQEIYSIEKVPAAKQKVIEAVREKICIGTEKVFFPRIQTELPYYFAQFWNKESTAVEEAVGKTDVDAFAAVIEQCFDYLAEKDIESAAYLTMCRNIVEIYGKILSSNGWEDDREFVEDVENVLDNSCSAKELAFSFRRTLIRHFSEYILQGNQKEKKPVRMAKEYIEKNYCKQISLGDIAEYVHLSPVYFSSLFKQEMGMNFSDYLIACRIDGAKKLLRDSNKSVLEISEAVGYTGAKYFCKLFRKNVGMTPLEYRKIYS